MRPCRAGLFPDWCTLGFQTQEGDKARGVREAIDWTDRGQQADCHNHVDPGDRHQSLRLRAAERVTRELAFQDVQILGQAIVLPQVSFDRGGLVVGQQLPKQPGAAFRPGNVRVRALRHEMRMQDRLDHRLQADALTHYLIAPGHLPAEAHRLLIQHPHLRQEPAGVQSGEDRGVDDVGLDPRLGNEMHLSRIGADYAADKRRHRLNDRLGAPGRFDNDMVIVRQLGSKGCQMVA
jgi:hypothetical protein